MDLDWTIGSLQLDPEARRQVAKAWADFFVEWGTLPMIRVLSGDRRGIIADIEQSPTGDHEALQSGDGLYRDRISSPRPPRSNNWRPRFGNWGS